MRKKFLEYGPEIFENYELLEMLLFNVIPYKDTNPIAHRLVSTFGSLFKVFTANVDDLLKVEGMTFNAAVFLNMFPAIYKRIEEERVNNVSFISERHECAAILEPEFLFAKNEKFCALFLDGMGKVLGVKCLFEGSFNVTQMSSKILLEKAFSYNSVCVCIAHNHPVGTSIPSRQDISSTQEIDKALKGVGITLLDHLIFDSNNDYVSFVDSGYL